MINDKTNPINNDMACVFVILGGTGDLTKRKLIPALYQLYSEKKVSENFAVVSVGRREYSDEEYRAQMEQDTLKYGENKFNKEKWDEFSKIVYYKAFDMVTGSDGYTDLEVFLMSLDRTKQTDRNRIFYLAVGPNLFLPILKNLKARGMLENQIGWQRIMIEKPFGYNLDSARELQTDLLELVTEEQIFRIDHYLGKEMLQNIVAIRFSNSIFESLWNQRYIENIQINSSETIGIESRGSYYEGSGILRDMVQSHILQMLSLICMEPPIDLTADNVRDEKVKVLKSLQLFDPESAKANIVLGQYGKNEANGLIGYREEENVAKDSMVPTYVALKAEIKNYRWGGIPIYIRAGKRLEGKTSEIIIQFKKNPSITIYDEYKDTEPDFLIIKIQPDEGIKFQINIKEPGDSDAIEKVEMDYCQTCRYTINSPQAYERLILEAIQNDPSLFTRWDEVEAAWEYIDSIENSISKVHPNFPNYPAGSMGPGDAAILLNGTKVYRDREVAKT